MVREDQILAWALPGDDDRPGHLVWHGPEAGLWAEATPTLGVDGRVYFTEVRLGGFAPDDAPVVRLGVRARRPIASDELRAVPITSMLSAANGRFRASILRALAVHGDAEVSARARSALDALGEVPASAETVRATGAPEMQFSGAVSEGRKPDAFYRAVAAAYTWLVEEGNSRRPVARLAEINDVPVATMRRWIREARRRGVLGPAVQGRAGL